MHAHDANPDAAPEQVGGLPTWHVLLRALREARGVTQDGFAAHIGVSRRTVQRWEQGALLPDAAAEDAIVGFCRDKGLFRRFTSGLLAGQTVTPDGLRDALARARGAAQAAPSHGAPSRDDLQRATPAPARLPVPLTRLIGRDRELAEIGGLLHERRLLTLTGPGGIGKTRLALAVTDVVGSAYPDGVVFVDLSSLRDARLVGAAIAHALGVHETGGRTLPEALRGWLQARALLLVLDNFEQVMDAASLVSDLLVAAPHLAVVVTSRMVLRVPGEQEYAVPSLRVPGSGQAVPADLLRVSPAVALFVERAQGVAPAFVLSEANAAAVADICRRLDGLPLALELAAARCRVLSPEALRARLEHRLPLLTGGGRGVPERQRTLTDTIAWSHDLLPPAEQVLFRRLAVFAGSFTFEAAEAVCSLAGDLSLDLLDGMESLVEQSLLQRQDGDDGEPRFTMLATIREFGRERLAASGEDATMRAAHAHYVTRSAEAADRRHLEALVRGAEFSVGVPILQVLASLHDDVHAALAWSVDQGDVRMGLRLLATFWNLYGGSLLPPSEGLVWAERLLAVLWEYADADGEGRRLQARALFAGGRIAGALRLRQQTRRWLAQSVAYWRSVPVDDVEAQTKLGLALALLSLVADDPPAARALADEAMSLTRMAGPWPTVLVQLVQATGALHGEDPTLAEQPLREVLALAGQGPVGARMWERPLLLYLQGLLAFRRGELQPAAAHFDECRVRAAAVGERRYGTRAQAFGALIALEREAVDDARPALEESLRTCRETGDLVATWAALVGMAERVWREGQPVPAARLLGAVATIADAARIRIHVRFATEREVRDAIGAVAFQHAYQEGRTLAFEAAIALALEVSTPR